MGGDRIGGRVGGGDALTLRIDTRHLERVGAGTCDLTSAETAHVAREVVLLRAAVDRLTVALHEIRRALVCETSVNISRDLHQLRLQLDAERQALGLGPSPVEKRWDGEECDDDEGRD